MTDNPTRSKFLLLVCGIVLCAAVGWKVVRYTTPSQRMTMTFDQRLTEFLDAHHWARQAPSPDTKNKAVQIITFTNSQCPKPLRISIVGRTSGLESYLRQKFGDDIAFVQHGSVLKHPSLLRYQITSAWIKLIARVSGREAKRQPIVAVTPGPRKTAETCNGPTIDQWESF